VTPIKLDVDSLEVSTFETSDAPDFLLAQGAQVAQPNCSDCFSTCNLLFSIVGC
jgi:hypothetical protein